MTQEIKKSFNLTKEKIEEFKKLNEEEKEKNKFFLKTALNDIISYVKYSLVQIGDGIDIDVNPNHSIKRKIETIVFFSDILSPEDTEFLNEIEKNRNKISHNDDYFPKLEETEVIIVRFSSFYNDVNKKVSKYSYTKKDLLNNIKKIIEKIKIIKPLFAKTTQELHDLFQQNLNFAIKLIETNRVESLLDARKQIQTVYSKIEELCPFRKEFMDIIKDYDDTTLNNPLIVMEKYFDENDWSCPACEYDDIHNEFYVCALYESSGDKEVISFKPLKLKGTSSKAYGTHPFCEVSYDGHCLYCHSSDMVYARDPPDGSVWCESCGFCFIPGEKVGFTNDFSQ